MEKWFLKVKRADFELWSKTLGIDVVTARILRNRDIETIEDAREFLYATPNDMHSPTLLKDMDKACDIILKAINDKHRIKIIGDYDVDGVTSSYILNKGLECLGADVSTAIPHRIHDGYGLSDGLVEDAALEGVELIVTCDNGISAVSQIELAKSRGIEVVVTDHHEVPFEVVEDISDIATGEVYKQTENGYHIQRIPAAGAVVNPKRYDCKYPFKGICGAMVAFKLVSNLARITENALLMSKLNELIQFAALGTVCDVMDLKGENRIAVVWGIKEMARTENIGLAALMDVNGIDRSKLSASNFGFIIGPCVNASGRLDTAQRALALFNSKSAAEAITIATELKALNDSRKNLTAEGIELAEEYIKTHNLNEKSVWIIFLPDVHESIAGIIAGKVRERHNHPVFVLTRGEEGVKGSGRSIEGYHMQESLVGVSSLLDRFGGHAMAAGLSLREENIGALEDALNARAKLSEEDFATKVSIDMSLDIEYANIELVKELNRLEPFGTGNPHPLFVQRDVEFLSMRFFGAQNQYARFRVKTPYGNIAELTSFSDSSDFCKYVDDKFGNGAAKALAGGQMNPDGSRVKLNVTYELSINTYQGEHVQFIMRNFR